MKRILLLLVALLPLVADAKTPVEQDIIDRITDQRSPYYYLKLMMRYTNGALDLTDEDYHYLYYGFAYQDAYKPLETNPDKEEMLSLMQGMDPDKVERERLEQLLSRANAARMRDPFSPQILNVLTFVHQMLGNDAEAQRWAKHLNGVMRTIVSSGDGLTIKSPRHILMFDHALDVMAAEGLAAGDARVVSRTVEFVPLLSTQVIGGKKRKGLYFNFERIYRNKPEGYTYKRERTWQFNNLKPREYK
ncbi:MAG: DUF4919 domain-containing protein [Alistipes sp.]|nr:DUF4919 domain-containing protein [Alistipes sp.]MBQ8580927.1 DUF4919 domain-containing protein [Alistipes sp.]